MRVKSDKLQGLSGQRGLRAPSPPAASSRARTDGGKRGKGFCPRHKSGEAAGSRTLPAALPGDQLNPRKLHRARRPRRDGEGPERCSLEAARVAPASGDGDRGPLAKGRASCGDRLARPPRSPLVRGLLKGRARALARSRKPPGHVLCYTNPRRKVFGVFSSSYRRPGEGVCVLSLGGAHRLPRGCWRDSQKLSEARNGGSHPYPPSPEGVGGQLQRCWRV